MRRARPRLLVAAFALGLTLTACDALRGSPPSPTPADFGAFAIELTARDVAISNVVSGDPGCDDLTLAPTAIAFKASGLDQPTAVQVRVYLFRDDAALQRRRADLDACVADWAADPATFELVDATPFVLAGQGPWGADFKNALRASVRNAAGD